MGNNVLPHTVLISPADHTDVLFVLEVVLPVLTWSTIRFKVQLKRQRILGYKGWIIKVTNLNQNYNLLPFAKVGNTTGTDKLHVFSMYYGSVPLHYLSPRE